MPKNRRKSSFASEALLECQDKKSSIVSTYSISSRTRRRRSSMATLNPSQSQIEKNVNPNSKDVIEVAECANESDNANDQNMECDYSSDEDLFANIAACVPRKSSPPPSPVLKTSFKSQSYKDSSLKNSINSECGDDTLIAKFARDADRNAINADNSATRQGQMLPDPACKAVHEPDDSVFSDIDMSYFERNCTAAIRSNEYQALENDSPKPTDKLTNTPLSLSKRNNPKTLSVTPVMKNPVPLAASTPASGRRKSMAEKLAERYKANAMQVTATNFPLQDAVKIFPELLMDFSQDVFRKEGKSAGPFYGLPMKVKELMVSTRGIKKFYAWQEECLSLPSIVQGKNFIYTLPTSGGKTLVAEMLIMKELMCMKRDAMLVLPFVAIVQEKVRGIAQFADELDFLVEEYAGSKGKFPPTKRRKRKSLFICTIEKANTLVNSLIEAGRLDTIGLVVIDELHMLGEGGRRGAAIEMTLAKIMHVSRSTQIIGMTATLSNIEDLSKFLNAEVYKNNFRPVTLDEFVKVEECLYRVDNKGSNLEDGLALARVIKCPDKEIAAKDTDHIVTLLLEIVPKHSSLVFCPTKKNCENVAVLICKLLPSSFKELHVKEKRAILETLYQDSGGEGLCPVLMKTIPYGVAYHHSGLTSDERSLIESAYNNGVLCVITCTSTLAAGVNLPARRVIIRSPYIGQGFLSRSQYKQMIGRAGRAGIDTKGESVLILTKAQDREKVMELVTGPVETCVSSLMYDGGRGFKTLILNLIHLKIMTKMSDVKDFFKQTLIAVQLKSMPDRFEYIATGDAALTETVIVEKVTKNALQELLDLKLIRLRSIKEDIDTEEVKDVADCSLEVTKLGAATNRGSIDFSISNVVYEDLVAGLKNLVLTSYLHLLYLVTPLDGLSNISPDWMIYFEEFCRLSQEDQNAATVIGVPECYLAMRAAGNRSKSKKYKDEVAKRFYVTLMLYQLFRGKSVWHVASRFEQPRGYLQSLLSSSAAFASCVLHFTKELDEFWPYHSLLQRLIQTLQYCTSMELLPLMEIPGVKLARAKQLLNAGFKSLAHVAKADVGKLVKSIEHLSRRQALQITASAKVLLKERVEELQAEAEALQTVPVMSQNRN